LIRKRSRPIRLPNSRSKPLGTFGAAITALRHTFLIFFILAIVCSVWIFVVSESTNYSWDFSTHWNRFLELGAPLESGFLEGIAAVWHSIRYSEYNLLPALLLQPFYFIEADLRLCFILGISILFVLPAIGLLALLLAQETEQIKYTNLFLIALLFGLLLPQVWHLTLRGWLCRSRRLNSLRLHFIYPC